MRDLQASSVATGDFSGSLPVIQSEREYVRSTLTTPSSADTLYIATTTPEPGHDVVSGATLVFEAGHASQLHARYHVDREARRRGDRPLAESELHTLTLCADRVVVVGTLDLPETRVEIFARELELRAASLSDLGCIKTTPLESALGRALDARPPDLAGDDGAAGRKAGHVILHVRCLRVPAEGADAAGFVMRGGDGQDGGHGKGSKLDTPPLMPGAGGSGGSGGVLRVLAQVQIEHAPGVPAAQQDLAAYVDNAGGAGGRGGRLGDQPVLFATPGAGVFEPGRFGGVSAQLRNAFETRGIPLGDSPFVAHDDVAHWAYSIASTSLALHKDWSWGFVLNDRQRLVSQIDLARFQGALDAGTVPDSFREWMAETAGWTDVPAKLEQYHRRGRSAQAEWLQRWVADYSPIPGPHAFVQKDELRWWLVDPETGATLMLESSTRLPQYADLYAVRRYGMVGAWPSESGQRMLVFQGAHQWCLALPAGPDGELDRSRVPQRLREELARRTHRTLSAAAEVWVLWRGHNWLVRDGDIQLYVSGVFEPVWIDTPAGRQKDLDRLVGLSANMRFERTLVEPAPARGARPLIERLAATNAWLHPHQLRAILEYTRDAYLTGHGEDALAVLGAYRDALALEPAADAGWGSTLDTAEYGRARLEVCTILHRVQSHLDYFGHPAGWAPLLSLGACMRMYSDELERALRTLVLVKWIERRSAQEQSATRALETAIDALGKDIQAAAGDVLRAEAHLEGLASRLEALKAEVHQLREDLRIHRDELRRKYEADHAKKAWIDFAFTTFSAVCSVIPVGQPALGAVGSLSKVIEGMATGGDPLEGAVAGIHVLGKAAGAWLDDQSKHIVDAAEKSPEVVAAKDRARALSGAAARMGPSLGDLGNAIQALSVPQSEIDAAVAQLEAQDPTCVDLSWRLRAVSRTKAELADAIHETVQGLMEAYGRVNGACVTIASLSRQRGKKLALLDHDALRSVREMDQRARQALVRHLYYVVKSCETTLLEPLGSGSTEVDYRLTAVFDRIETLLSADATVAAGFDPARLDAFVAQLRPLFEDNLTRIERSLLERYLSSGRERWANDPAPECRLSATQTPDVIRRLNADGEAVINLKSLGIIPPGYERIRILGVEVLADERNRPQFSASPAEGTVRVIVEALDDGTLRSEGRLYAVRHPVQQICGWSYHFSDGSLELGERSTSSIALLRELLERRRQETGPIDVTSFQASELLVPPPAWGDVRIRYDTSDLAGQSAEPPQLVSLVLRWHFDVLAAAEDHRVLDVRSTGLDGVGPTIQCDRADIGGKASGMGDFYRIYKQGSRITLTAPQALGEAAVFAGWDVYRGAQRMEVQSHRLELTLTHNTQLYCRYASPPARVVQTLAPLASKGLLQLAPAGAEAAPALSVELRTTASLQGAGEAGFRREDLGFEVLEGPHTLEGRQWWKIDQEGRLGWAYALSDGRCEAE